MKKIETTRRRSLVGWAMQIKDISPPYVLPIMETLLPPKQQIIEIINIFILNHNTNNSNINISIINT